MFISKVIIEGFRNFEATEIVFNEGINVVIGHNNAGKTNLLRALALVFDTAMNSKRLEVDDFHKNVSIASLKASPPKVKISAYLTESNDESLYKDDIVTVSNWITKLDAPYEAQLTYEFFLPLKETSEYFKVVDELNDVDEVWKALRRDFIRKYTYRIFGGDPKFQNQAEAENLQKFDFQFLNAIRDVERDMLLYSYSVFSRIRETRDR
jgi:putative ATP-dependent endonuclease of OLD family